MTTEARLTTELSPIITRPALLLGVDGWIADYVTLDDTGAAPGNFSTANGVGQSTYWRRQSVSDSPIAIYFAVGVAPSPRSIASIQDIVAAANNASNQSAFLPHHVAELRQALDAATTHLADERAKGLRSAERATVATNKAEAIHAQARKWKARALAAEQARDAAEQSAIDVHTASLTLVANMAKQPAPQLVNYKPHVSAATISGKVIADGIHAVLEPGDLTVNGPHQCEIATQLRAERDKAVDDLGTLRHDLETLERLMGENDTSANRTADELRRERNALSAVLDSFGVKTVSILSGGDLAARMTDGREFHFRKPDAAASILSSSDDRTVTIHFGHANTPTYRAATEGREQFTPNAAMQADCAEQLNDSERHALSSQALVLRELVKNRDRDIETLSSELDGLRVTNRGNAENAVAAKQENARLTELLEDAQQDRCIQVELIEGLRNQLDVKAGSERALVNALDHIRVINDTHQNVKIHAQTVSEVLAQIIDTLRADQALEPRTGPRKVLCQNAERGKDQIQHLIDQL